MRNTNYKSRMMAFIRLVRITFNGLPIYDKKGYLISFGVIAALVCAVPIVKGLTGKGYQQRIAIESIKVPKDIFMKNENTISEEHLIPVGKFKGEINGEFEAFYLAVDAKGSTFINRSIDYSKTAYQKANGWQEITRQELERYQQELHFLPARSKGIRR